MALTVILVLTLIEVLLTDCTCGWSYEGSHGPRAWANTYPDCGGQRQSPIDLSNFTSMRQPQLVWSGYDDFPEKMTLTNTGHSVVLTAEGVTPKIKLSDGRIFQLDYLIFHWGAKNDEGSEHTLQGQRFSLEMQGVHNRVNDDGTPRSPPELIAVTIFFEYSPTTTGFKNGLDYLNITFPGVVKAGTAVEVDPFPWSGLLHQFTKDFYWYEGSLTTPPCLETVTYFLRRHVRKVSMYQMGLFRQLLNKKNKPISGNFRPLQDRNNRQVYYHGY